MESIFHEKQEGSLCAQHCLNNLLQGEYFSPVELSSIAHQLDEEERMRMAEGGVTSEDYRTFLQTAAKAATAAAAAAAGGPIRTEFTSM
ncbi:ataxin-3 isoform b [Homo sapiens]|uniref:ataxin-3 isoform b n=1 Tax=Homo sapiens TaxID=9606 RepID=UPI0001B71064|nr:ataxin-3 isoform b [Homo sapiens]|eukprot:NP_001158246.1 ataxin-3 isoform b [Homo sapiens]